VRGFSSTIGCCVLKLEDAMTMNSAANRTKKGLESELENLQEQLDSQLRTKQEVKTLFD
jgi:hypothetical protein